MSIKRNSEVYNDDTVQKAKKQIQLSKEYCEPYFQRFIDNYKHYFLRLIDEAVAEDDDAYPFYSRMSLPISYQIVETILPRMFNRLPTFSIETEEENDEKDELALRNLIRFQLNHPYLIDDPIFLRLASAAKELFITGNVWFEVPWMNKEIEVMEWQPYSPEMGLDNASWDNIAKIKEFQVGDNPNLKPRYKLVKVKKNVIDAPVFQHKSIFHMFPDPKKKYVSQLGYIWNEENMTFDQIMEMINQSPKDYQYVDNFRKMKAMRENSSADQTNYDQQLAEMFGSSDFSNKDDTEGQFKVWIGRTPEKMEIIINEKLCIRNGANPNGDGKLGVGLMKDIPVPHELFAWGEPDPIKRMEDGMTDQFNMRNDSIFYDLMKMWKMESGSLIDGEEFVPEPGSVVQMKDGKINALQPLETGVTKATSYKEYNEWEKILQNASGVSDYATGSADPSMNQTKGGVEMLQQAANARFAFKLQLFEQLGLKAMGTMYVQRNLRFFDTPQTVNTDKGKVKVTPDQIRRLRGNVHFIVESGSTEAVNANTEMNKWKTIADYVAEDKAPFDNLVQESKDKIAKKMLFALKVNDAEELIKRNPPVVMPPPGDPGSATGTVIPGITPPVVTEQAPTNGNTQTVPENSPVPPTDGAAAQ